MQSEASEEDDIEEDENREPELQSEASEEDDIEEDENENKSKVGRNLLSN